MRTDCVLVHVERKVALLSFLVGFLFMVLLRFLIKPCVWLLPQELTIS